MDNNRDRSSLRDVMAHALGAIGARLHQMDSELPAPFGVVVKLDKIAYPLSALEIRELGEYVLIAKRGQGADFAGRLVHKTQLQLEVAVKSLSERETPEQRRAAAPAFSPM